MHKLNILFDKLSPVLSIIIVVLIGIYASVRANLLNESFPFSCGEPLKNCQTQSTEVIIFYIIALPLLILIVFQQARTAQRDKSRTENLLQETQQLVKVAPPMHLLKYTEKQYTALNKLLKATQENGSISEDDVSFCIRTILRSMIDVASYWDTHKEKRESEDAIYRASVMRAIPANWFSDTKDFEDSLFKHAKFLNMNKLADRNSPPDHEFYLATEHELRVSNKDGLGECDTSLDPLILGGAAKKPDNPNPPSSIIPGAPTSLYYGVPQYIKDVSRIAQISLKDKYLAPYSSLIEDYYNRSSIHRSILSIPIQLDTDSDEQTYSAVLNIFCDKTDLLGGEEETCLHYVSLMSPTIILLESFMEAYLKKV